MKTVPHLVKLGFVLRAHGLRGEVQARGTRGGALTALTRVFVGASEAAAGERRIDSARDVGGGEVVLRFVGVDDRSAAEALRGASIWARRDELPAVADDEVYVDDLLGCAVLDREGRALGTVRGMSGGAQDLLVIERPDGREGLIPFIEPIVIGVDLAARVVTCDPPEGLLEP